MKIAIGIPCYGDPKLKFMQSLVNLLNRMHTVKLMDESGERIPVDVDVMIVSCSDLRQSRHKLVAEATFWEADFLLWLDADHTFPPDAFERLWAHGVAVAGCNYARRCHPTAPTAAGFEDNGYKSLVYTTEEKAKAGDLEEVAHLGFGVCLIDMRIFDLMQARAEEKGEKSFLPLFRFGDDEDGPIGEDVFFFSKVRDAGVKVFVDHGLSWEVGHIHEQIMTNAHANVQRDRWNEKNEQTRKRYEEKAAEKEAVE